MARKLRVEYPGAIYHVMNRGDRREAIFRDDPDRVRFLETLEEACEKTGWQVHAFCLMGNHFHLVLETPRANLVAGMKWFLGTYTSRFNRRHRLFGHLFSGRYKALLVEGGEHGYLRTVSEYVHLNPVRADLIEPEQRLSAYRWSSYPEYLKRPGRRPRWLRVDRVFGEMGIVKDSAKERRWFEQVMEQKRREGEEDGEWKAVRRGWCLGSIQFRDQLLEMMEGKCGEHHYGEERRETEEARAERLVREGLKKAKWKEEDLGRRRKSDRLKVRLAQQLRRETAMPLKWIAERLRMGGWQYVNRLLYEERKRARQSSKS